MITYLRNIIAHFLLLNEDMKVNDARLIDVISESYASMEEYVKHVILKPGEPARLLSLLVCPMVLRISLVCVVVDISAPDQLDKLVAEDFSARATGLDYRVGDGLDQHDERIAVLTMDQHYKVAYASEVFLHEANQVLLHYHEAFPSKPQVELSTKSVPPPLSPPEPADSTRIFEPPSSIQEEDKELSAQPLTHEPQPKQKSWDMMRITKRRGREGSLCWWSSGVWSATR
jgi:hypothetical protein